MEWTQNDLEKLYQEAMEKSKVDAEFRKELLDNPVKALSNLSGRELPEGLNLKFVEKNSSYQGSFVLPDFISDELDAAALKKVSGGISLVVGFSLCPVDVCVPNGGMPGTQDSCAAAVCGEDSADNTDSAADLCAAAVCGADVCGADGCGAYSADNTDSAADFCAANACVADSADNTDSVADFCVAEVCGSDGCGEYFAENTDSVADFCVEYA